MKRLLLTLALTCPFALVSCGHATVQTNSPQTQTLNFVRTLKDANSAAVHTAVLLRDQGKLDAATVNKIEDVALTIVTLQNNLADELASGDTWTLQKQKIISSITGFGFSKITSDPTLQSAYAQVLSLIQQIKSQVSQ